MAGPLGEKGYFYNWGYKYENTKGKGVVRQIIPEWEVYGYARVYTRAFGRTYSKSDTFYLGILYGWTTTRYTNSYNTVRLVRAGSEAQELFATADVPLGGDKETLG